MATTWLSTLWRSSLFLLSRPAAGCPPGTVPWPDEPCQPIANATTESTAFLRANMFKFDEPNAATLFDGGIVEPTVKLALEARAKFGWAGKVPRDIFESAVLPYASVNEARTDWRQLLWDLLVGGALGPQPWVTALPADSKIEAVALAVNAHVWADLGALTGRKAVVFKSEQTPLIYDPLSTILFGYASCTGISLAYVDSLRTLGVPARLVGTPAWHGKPSDGNHNWVEVWLSEEEGWRFIEGAPAGAGETFSNPCDKWFCNPAHFPKVNGTDEGATKVFATTYSKVGSTVYPMAWDLANKDVAGVDRSAYYNEVCGAC